MVSKYGGTALEDFPPQETPDGPEFYIEATINQAGSTYTELKVLATNHSAWPARIVKDLSYNYYFDLTEVFDAGYTIDDVSVRKGYDEWSNTEISEPIQYEGNIYYVKITYPDGSVVAPIGQEQNQAELQFRISIPDGTNIWDPSNDYSYEGLEGSNVLNVTDRITMYDGDVLIYGTEPDGTKPTTDVPEETTTVEETTTIESSTSSDTETTASDTTPSTTPEESGSTVITTVDSTTTGGDSSDSSDTDTSESEIRATMYGDVNLDGKIDISDVILLNRYLVQSETLDSVQKENANCVYDSVIDVNDSFAIMRCICNIITSSDLGKND
jgi:hypothetical protein